MKNMIKTSLIYLPSPSNINYWWNLGFMLSMTLINQIITGLFLSFHYCPNSYLAFQSMSHINRDIFMGWWMQLFHMNGASMFFILIYFHMARGLFYSSFNNMKVWMSGLTILIILMMTAFLGYVLPWGQMSFWGATVITNLFSSIPYIGTMLVTWIWGGYSVSNSTLNRFFSLHFILPFILLVLVLIHLMILHEKGSSNPLGLNSNKDKIPFNPYFTWKDISILLLLYSIFSITILTLPYTFSDPENFNLANPMITPVHIQPEWYFLFAYAILRSIPNKLGGVMALMLSLISLSLLSMKKKYFYNTKFMYFYQTILWLWFNSFIILTWLGSCPVEDPFIIMSQMYSIMYFTLLLAMILI